MDCVNQRVSVTASASPSGTYTYSISPAAVSGNPSTGAFVLNTGTNYTITATRSDNQCSLDRTYRRNPVPEISISNALEVQPVLCVGGNDGELSFTVANTSNFSWSVSNAGGSVVDSGNSSGSDPTTISVGSLPAGSFTISVSDGSSVASPSCSDTASVTINEPSTSLSFSSVATASNCGVDSGRITVSASGGRGSYQYRLETSSGTVVVDYPNTNATFTGLAVGTYTILVRDGNSSATSCEISASETISEFASPSIALANGGDPCFDGVDQASQWISVTLGITTPAGPFEYILNRGSGNETPVGVTFLPAPNSSSFEIGSLTNGSYSVFIRNTNTGCTSNTLTFSLDPELTITSSLVKDIDCNGDASISFTASGGDGNYSYEVFRSGGTPPL